MLSVTVDTLRRLKVMASLLILLSLVACTGGSGGNSDPTDAACAAITGGGSTVEHTGTCNGCNSAGIAAAGDGLTSSFATLSFPATASGTSGVLVTAQDGVVYPAGTPAAVIAAIYYDGNSTTTRVSLNTYLNGVPQEKKSAGDTNVIGGPDEPLGRSSFTASLPFDAIELSYERLGGAGSVEVLVYEFCTN